MAKVTNDGLAVFAELGSVAVGFDRQLRDMLGCEQAGQLLALLRRLLGISPDSAKSKIGSQ